MDYVSEIEEIRKPSRKEYEGEIIGYSCRAIENLSQSDRKLVFFCFR